MATGMMAVGSRKALITALPGPNFGRMGIIQIRTTGEIIVMLATAAAGSRRNSIYPAGLVPK